MRKHSLIAPFILFLTQISFAATMDSNNANSGCKAIAAACKSAGFTDKGVSARSFWFGCMKPLLYGNTVSNVTVNHDSVKACRQAKIAKMEKEIKELQALH
ncbi:hypothetical protein ACNVED_01015 [Legionella sp. D16C41]|uniref:hypothetical protein n=1 Tax=Legionella sp. D16C41 TaxID=3402688 RepID=UPI003AF4492A